MTRREKQELKRQASEYKVTGRVPRWFKKNYGYNSAAWKRANKEAKCLKI